MISRYTNTFFPMCSLVISILIVVMYFMRKKVKNEETEIYSKLIITGLVESSFYVVLTILVNSIYETNLNWLFATLNKTLACIYIVWMTFFLFYTIAVSTKDNNKKIKAKRYIWPLTVIFSIIVFSLPIELYFDRTLYQSNSFGAALNFLYFAISTYIALMVYIVIKNRKKEELKSKYIPLYLLFGLLTFSLVLRLIDPLFNVTSNVLSLVLLVMYHTIENPDVKMLEKIEIAKDQADKANRAKTDFLSSMSHEIRTPLNAIVGFSDYIMSADSLDEAKENAKDIVNASNTLLEIVNGILDISKIEAGKLEIVNSKYNARQTFEALAKLITPKMKEKGLDFSYYIAPDLPDTLFGDHANLKKIITNLLSNAYKYTETGSVRYEVNCINNSNITKLIITVEDTGRGIKPDKIDSLFTKFQRLDEDKNTTIEGTGLGLAITKQLIELMGGKILVHTVYGEGSKFTVVLNQHIEKTEIVEEKVEIKTTLDLKNKKILLVDDNSLNIKVANKILERFNANNITSLDNGFDCIDLIQSGAVFDIILMDDMMPKMSGVETYHKLKEIEGFNQPVVILTANAITGMKEKYLKEGFEDYLAKPIEKDELIRVCNTIFQKYKSNQPEPPEEDIVEVPVIEKSEPVIDVQNIEEIKPIEAVEKIEEIELIEPIQHVEEVEELEIIGEDEPTVVSKESYLKENGVALDNSLELLGDIEMYNMTMSDFLSEVEDKWNNIVTYKNNSDMENYAIEVHSLKSDAKYLGFMSLADISYQHELKSKENDSDYVHKHFSELETEYNKALSIAKTYNKM